MATNFKFFDKLKDPIITNNEQFAIETDMFEVIICYPEHGVTRIEPVYIRTPSGFKLEGEWMNTTPYLHCIKLSINKGTFAKNEP